MFENISMLKKSKIVFQIKYYLTSLASLGSAGSSVCKQLTMALRFL